MTVILLFTACLLVSDDDLGDRMDGDGDGVPRPEDCDDSDPSVALLQTWHVDADGDGYAGEQALTGCRRPDDAFDSGDDCDDTDQSVHPGARDVCDEVDTDCNGTVDDLRWYEDADDDGYGNPDRVTFNCDQPVYFVVDDTDCDDTRATVHPGAVEVCDDDDLDQDCNGLADDADPAATGQTAWYVDDDGDGYGVSSTERLACDPVGTEVAVPGDCDDTTALVNPAQAETWYDGVDADCAGDDDFDQDGDGFQAESHGGGDCDDASGLVNPDAVEACGDGVDNDCDGVDSGRCALDGEVPLDTADVTYIGDDYGLSSGSYVAAAGDVDGDGTCDVLIGAPFWDDDVREGAVYVASGADRGMVYLEDAMARITGGTPEDQAGNMMLGPGDLDGDGFDDIVLGVAHTDDFRGAVYVAHGPLSGGLQVTTTALDRVVAGQAQYDGVGAFLGAAGDATGDGVPDLWVGSSGYAEDGSGNGAASLIAGPLNEGMDLADAHASVALADTDAYSLSGPLASGQDVDGDGVSDLLLGSRYSDEGAENIGAAYLLLGPLSGATTTDAADAMVIGDVGDDYAGWGVSLGDQDADGYADLAVGAPSAVPAGGEPSAGVATVFRGPITGTRAIASADAQLWGEISHDSVGASLSMDGDVNGDGRADLLVGGVGYYSSGTAGGAYLMYGPVSGLTTRSDADVVLPGTEVQQYIGSSVHIVPSIDGDPFDDVLIGGPGVNTREYGDGATFLFFGGGVSGR